MRTIAKILLAIIAIWAFASLFMALGCRSAKQNSLHKDSLVIRDSVREVVKVKEMVKFIEKDSVVFKDSLRIREVFNCNENQVYLVNRSGDEFRIQIKDGKVFLNVDLKGTQSRFNSIISASSKEVDSLLQANNQLQHRIESSKTTIIEKKKPWYYAPLIYILYLLALYGFISLIFDAVKFLVPFK